MAGNEEKKSVTNVRGVLILERTVQGEEMDVE